MATVDSYPWLEDTAEMSKLASAAVERGADPGLANFLAMTAGMQRYVRRANGNPPLEYSCYEEFVLRHGKAFTPPNQPRPKGLRKGADKMCFQNAGRAVLTHRGWRYVEGYAIGIIPVHHAWCTDEFGIVVETTWREPGSAYFGVIIPRTTLHKIILRNGRWGALSYDLLQQEWTGGED